MTDLAPSLCILSIVAYRRVHASARTRCPDGNHADRPVFPGVDLTNLLLVPTLQKARVTLDCYGDKQEAEKDRLQAAFFKWADEFRARLAAHGYWVDATEPATGAARHGPSAALYSDVPTMARLLRYPTSDCGGCTILLHPEWRSSVYPATVFTTAPQDAVLKALHAMNQTSP